MCRISSINSTIHRTFADFDSVPSLGPRPKKTTTWTGPKNLTEVDVWEMGYFTQMCPIRLSGLFHHNIPDFFPLGEITPSPFSNSPLQRRIDPLVHPG